MLLPLPYCCKTALFFCQRRSSPLSASPWIRKIKEIIRKTKDSQIPWIYKPMHKLYEFQKAVHERCAHANANQDTKASGLNKQERRRKKSPMECIVPPFRIMYTTFTPHKKKRTKHTCTTFCSTNLISNTNWLNCNEKFGSLVQYTPL